MPELQLEIRSLRSGLETLSTRLDQQAALIAAQAERLAHMENSMPSAGASTTSRAQDHNPKGKSKGYMGSKGSKDKRAKGKKGQASPSTVSDMFTAERARSLPDKASQEGGPVAYQISLGMPWRTFGPNEETFEWHTAGKNAVANVAKAAAKALLQAYADEHSIPLSGRSMIRIALKHRGFWISYRGGVAYAAHTHHSQPSRNLPSPRISTDSDNTESYTDEAD